MRTSGIEELKTVLRRSAFLIVGVVIIGVLAMNVIRYFGGDEYKARARVILDTNDLSAAALGISPPYQDPARKDEAEQNLLDSPQFYAYAAQRVSGHVSTAGQLEAATSATVSNNVVAFTATSSDSTQARLVVNVVATAYPHWRAKVRGQAVESAIAQVRAQIAQSGETPELTGRLQDLRVLKTLTSGETLFVDQATSSTKTAPRPVSDSLLGGAIGLVVALLLVGGRELFDTTVRSEGDVEEALEVPVLATIESLPRRFRNAALDARSGRFNDEYDLLAANIAQMFDGHGGPVHLAVTSAMPGEGKTTTATNLAAALSRRAENVVLADFDLRKPVLSEFVGIPRGAAGIAEMLEGSTDLHSVLWHISPNGEAPQLGDVTELPAMSWRRTEVASNEPEGQTEGSLKVIPGGRLVRGSLSRFAKLPALLDQLPADTGFVVLDTPPALLVAGVADLAQSVDGVVVVVRHGYVHRRRLRSLARQARSWRARTVGAVLNDAPLNESYPNYYYGRS